MKASIWPHTHGDTFLALRYRTNEAGDVVPALVAVNADGSERDFGCLVDVRDGGGHLEFCRLPVIATDLGFVRDGERVQVTDV